MFTSILVSRLAVTQTAPRNNPKEDISQAELPLISPDFPGWRWTVRGGLPFIV
jgi:hypothetical protein